MDGQNHEQAAHGLHDYQEQLDLLVAENNRRLQTFTGQQDPSTFSSHPQSTHDRSQHRRHLSHGVLHNLNVPAAGASSLNSIPYHSHYDGGNVTLPPILSHAQASFRAGQDTTRPDQSRAEMSASVIPPYNIDSSSTTATHGLHSQYIGSGHPASGLYMPPTDHVSYTSFQIRELIVLRLIRIRVRRGTLTEALVAAQGTWALRIMGLGQVYTVCLGLEASRCRQSRAQQARPPPLTLAPIASWDPRALRKRERARRRHRMHPRDAAPS